VTPAGVRRAARRRVNLYLSIRGYRAQLTLRDMNEDRLLARLGAILQRFPAPPEPPQKGTDKPAEPETPENWCRRHDCEMPRWEKDGRVWFSHKADDNSWCRGK
jgi:hypothetical protein